MKILLLRNLNPYVESGASGNRFCGLVNSICRQGHHVTICVMDGVQKKDEKSMLCDYPNLDFVYLSKSNRFHKLWGRLNTYILDGIIFRLARIRLKRLLKHQYDVMWLANNGRVLQMFMDVKSGFKGKSLIELNEFNDIYKDYSKNNYFQRRKGEKEDMSFIKAIKMIDMIAVMTNTLSDYYHTMTKPDARYLLLPMTVDLSRFNEDRVKECTYQKPYIAFTGTMNNQKDGVDVLINAFSIIEKKYPTLHLYLVGFWHYDVQMQDAMIAQYGLQERIHRVGLLEREQIPAFLINAKLLALSRPDSHQAQGGFPTKLGEYLATGNPVCVTKVGEIPDYLEDNVSAFMAAPGSVESFADAMDRALCNPDNAKRVGAQGKKVAESTFNVEVQSRRLIDFIKDTLNNK